MCVAFNGGVGIIDPAPLLLLRANCNRLIAMIRQAGFDFFTKILYFTEIKSPRLCGTKV